MDKDVPLLLDEVEEHAKPLHFLLKPDYLGQENRIYVSAQCLPSSAHSNTHKHTQTHTHPQGRNAVSHDHRLVGPRHRGDDAAHHLHAGDTQTVDRDAMVAEIEASFEAAKSTPRHPSKPDLEAVEILPVYPDFEVCVRVRPCLCVCVRASVCVPICHALCADPSLH